MQTVYLVTLDTAESVSIITDDGTVHSFGITEPVVFPRRPDGSHKVINVYEDVQVRIDDIFPGDLIRPINSQAGEEFELHEAWLVKTIYNIGDAGWVVYTTTDAGDGRSASFMVPRSNELNIYASGTTWPAAYYSGPRQFEPGNGGDVRDVYVGGTFEGYTQVLAGIDGDPVPFRVFALTDPSRLVIDIVDERAERPGGPNPH